MSNPRTVLPDASAPYLLDRLRLTHRLRNALKSAPLLVNGYAMVASTGLTSLLGVVFWVAATRLYDQSQVGLGAALIASMTTISYFCQMNLSTVLNRFLPTAGSHASQLIIKSYIAAGLVSGTVAFGFTLGIGTFAAPLAVLDSNPFATSVFVLATMIWTIFALQDAALSGLRLSVLIPFENTAYSLLKIAFLVGFAFIATSPASGIFLGWALALVPIVLVVNVLIFRHLNTRNVLGDASPVDLKTIAGFLSWDYAGSIFLAAALGLAPLMISSIVGVEANAPYHIAWTFTYSVYLIGRSMSVSLLAESAAYPLRLGRLTADTFCHTMLLVSCAVAVIWVAAPLILELFGAIYVSESTAILRVLILSCLPWAATTTFIATLRAKGQTRSVAILQLATLVIFAASSALLIHRQAALGVAYGWLIAHSSVLFGFTVICLARSRRGTMADYVLLLAASLAGIAGNIKRHAFKSVSSPYEKFPGQDRLLKRLDLEDHKPLRAPASASDSTTVLLAGRTAPAKTGADLISAVVKYSTTRSGIAALQRNARVLKALQSDSRLQDLRRRFPELLDEDQPDGVFLTVETALPGLDGRTFFRNTGEAAAAFTAVADFVNKMHERTPEPSRLNQLWATRWIDDPVSTISIATRSRRGADKRAATLECLRQDLRRLLIGRQIPLGRGHGDLSPGNVLLSRSKANPECLEISGLIDWDNSKPDAPLLVDLYHLALTARMLSSGEELGQVVRSCLLEAKLDISIAARFKAQTSLSDLQDGEDKDLNRAMLQLVWLHHISSNLIKSERYSRHWLWMRSNVDRVLGTIAAQTG